MAQVALGDLSAVAAGHTVTLRARVVDCQAGRLLLQDVTGALRLATEDSVAVGAWVEVQGLWNGSGLDSPRLRLVHAPARTPAVDGDWAWGQPPRLRALQARHQVLRRIRAYFDGGDFLEVETPAMVPCPGLEPHLDAFELQAAGPNRYLHTSPEYQMKRLLVAGLPRIYQICKAFRRDECGSLHEPEFTLLEWYRAFADADAVMRDTEAVVHAAALALNGHAGIERAGTRINLAPPWQRLTVAEAFERYAQTSVEDVLPDEERFFRLLVTRVEPQLGRTAPTFLTHYPAQFASLARRDPDNPAVALRFEAYVAGIELCNGFCELNDAAEQRQRCTDDQQRRAQLGKPPYPLDERFLAALQEGMPPSGGNALGVDRLIMLLTGAEKIGDVVAFEHARL